MSNELTAFEVGDEFVTMSEHVRTWGSEDLSRARVWRVGVDGIPVDVSAKKAED